MLPQKLLIEKQENLIKDYCFFRKCLPAVLGWNDPYFTHYHFSRKEGGSSIKGAVYPATQYQYNQAQLWNRQNLTQKEERQLRQEQKPLREKETARIDANYKDDYKRTQRKRAELEETRK